MVSRAFGQCLNGINAAVDNIQSRTPMSISLLVAISFYTKQTAAACRHVDMKSKNRIYPPGRLTASSWITGLSSRQYSFNLCNSSAEIYRPRSSSPILNVTLQINLAQTAVLTLRGPSGAPLAGRGCAQGSPSSLMWVAPFCPSVQHNNLARCKVTTICNLAIHGKTLPQSLC